MTEHLRPEGCRRQCLRRDRGDVGHNGLETGQVDSHLDDRQAGPPAAGDFDGLPRVGRAVENRRFPSKRSQC